jgi:hypothetical protein
LHYLAFILYFRSEDESDYELSDHEINKILIVTQATSQSSRYPKHEGYDRTGDWTTRVKITQDLEQIISDGLNYYEEGLWSEHEWVCAVFHTDVMCRCFLLASIKEQFPLKKLLQDF